MATKLRLPEGVELIVEMSLDDLVDAIEKAVQAGAWLRVNIGDEPVVVNPSQVLYVGEASEEELAAVIGGRRRVPVA